jgi:hypothetical protein
MLAVVCDLVPVSAAAGRVPCESSPADETACLINGCCWDAGTCYSPPGHRKSLPLSLLSHSFFSLSSVSTHLSHSPLSLLSISFLSAISFPLPCSLSLPPHSFSLVTFSPSSLSLSLSPSLFMFSLLSPSLFLHPSLYLSSSSPLLIAETP